MDDFHRDQTVGSGVAPQTLTNVTWNTRILTATQGVASVATLATNQFTLAAGEYLIEASAGAVDILHKVRIQNITDGATAKFGTSESGQTSNPSRSHVSARVVHATPKTFELQHYVNGGSVNGGIAVSSGGSEVYATVKITRLR